MAGSINKATIIGNLGDDPEIKTMQSGDKVCNFSVATSERWKDKSSGEVKERTEWHRVVIFNQGLIKICENYLEKGSKIYLEGQIETRNYEKDGRKIYTTEIVLRPYRGEITLLDGRGGNAKDDDPAHGFGFAADTGREAGRRPVDELDDEIPF